MYGTFIFLLHQDPTTQGTDTFEHRMTRFFESLYHFVGCGVPFSSLSVRRTSIPFFFRPRTQKCPVSLREFHSVIFGFLGIRNTILIILFLSMSLNIDIKMIRSLNSSGWIFFLADSIFEWKPETWCVLSCKQTHPVKRSLDLQRDKNAMDGFGDYMGR